MTTQLIHQLFDMTGEVSRIEDGPDGMFGVWLGDDLIGGGASMSEAYEDAIRTVRGWESAR